MYNKTKQNKTKQNKTKQHTILFQRPKLWNLLSRKFKTGRHYKLFQELIKKHLVNEWIVNGVVACLPTILKGSIH